MTARAPAVAIVSRGDLWPARHGAAVKIVRTAWAESFHARAVLLVTDDPRHYCVFRRGRRTTRPFPAALHAGRPAAADALLRRAGLPPGDAFLYRPLVSDLLARRLEWLARRHRVGLFQAEFPAFVRPCVDVRGRHGGRVLLVEHNVEFERIAAQNPGLPRTVRTWLRETEVALANQADAVVALSARDRDRLRAAGVTRPVHVVPPGVDGDAFARARPLDLRARYRLPRGVPVLVYHGVYRYPPNLEAVRVLAEDVLPRLGRRAIVLAIGLDPPAQRLHPDVRFVGPVGSLAPHLKGADLAVVALRQGSGVRLKLLEYFAAGVAVVATPKAAEGLPVRDGRELVLASSPAAIARAVAALLDDPGRRADLAARAATFARGYDWHDAARRHLASGLALSRPRVRRVSPSASATSPRSARGSRGTRGRRRRRPAG